MKRQLRKWTLRLMVTIFFVAGLLLIILLYPVMTYAGKSTYSRYVVYHNKTLNPLFIFHLKEADELVKTSELYDDKFQLQICLNDGSVYPSLMGTIRGQAFAWGFYNKVVLQGTMNCQSNFVKLNGYKWNLTQLLAHEITHCLQFNRLGVFKSNPIARIPNWKWEGYAEYVARKNASQADLRQNIDRLHRTADTAWAVTLEDDTVAPKNYYNHWSLVKYCLDVKKLNYLQLLRDTTSEKSTRQAMIKWYEQVNQNTKQ